MASVSSGGSDGVATEREHKQPRQVSESARVMAVEGQLLWPSTLVPPALMKKPRPELGLTGGRMRREMTKAVELSHSPRRSSHLCQI